MFTGIHSLWLVALLAIGNSTVYCLHCIYMTKHYRCGTLKMYRHLLAIRMSVPNDCTFIPLIQIFYFLYSDNGIDLMHS